MSNLKDWAMDQINRLDVSKERKKQYNHIFRAFSKQGHTGTTAPYVLAFVNKYIQDGYDAVKQKLDTTLKNSKDEMGIQSRITKDILEIIELFKKYEFGKEEANRLTRLMNWKPIVHLTGAEDEWGTPCDYGTDKVSQQNKVCSAVFRYNYDNNTAHYIEGRVYSDNGGHTWFTGNHGNGIVQSSILITFPFWVPDKPEYIYLNGEDSDEIITDKDRIKELYNEFSKKFEEDQV